MLDAATILLHHGEIARGTLLHRYGLTRGALSSAVRAGTIVRLRAGVFALPQADPDMITAAVHGGALTCSRALRLHGVWVLERGTAPHVWLGTHGRAHPHTDCDCVGHFFAGRTVLGLAPLEDALVHVYACEGAEVFFAALESALSLRKIRAAGRDRIRRRLPATAQWLVDLARTDSGSGLESLLRLRLHLAGIDLECQVEIATVGRVDFVIAGLLILETDGAEHHSSPRSRHRDLRRDAAASALGFETLRFDYAMVVHDWPIVESAIRGALARLSDRL
jgi:very-short-patch-repair endonuclease